MRNKTKKIILPILCATCAFSMAVGINNAFAQSDIAQQPAIEDTYAFNSIFDIPLVETDAGKCSAKITLPNGEIVSSNSIRLDQAGVYKLNYYQNKEIVYSDSFIVKQPAFFVTDDVSTAYYGEYEEGVEGLICELSAGESIEFTQILNLSEYSANEKLFELFPVPSVSGTPDITAMEITLTDIYDESNQLIMKPWIPTSGSAYILSRATKPNQPFSSLEWVSGGYKVHINQWGTGLSGFRFGPTTDYASNTFCARLDYDSKALYVQENKYAVDFDDPFCYANLWDGFTTGEVRISFKISEGAKGKFVLLNVADFNLKSQGTVDTVKPILTMDYGEYSQNSLPEPVVNQPYSIIPTTAFDKVVGDLPVNVRVYKNYYSNNRSNVYCDGKTFTPTSAGYYYVEYSARDWFDNVQTEVLTLKAKTSAQVEEIDIQFEDVVDQGNFGEYIPFAKMSATGGSGNKTITVKVFYNDKEVVCDKNGFIPYEEGIYTVKATATDYVNQENTESYTVNVAIANAPIFKTEYSVEARYLTGFKYQLPVLEVVDYNTGEKVTPTVSVKVDGVEKTIADGVFRPEEADVGKTVEITYTAVGSRGESKKTYTSTVVSVRDQNGLDFKKYLQGIEAEHIEETEDFISIYFQDGSQMQFLNTLLLRTFSMRFSLYNTNGSFNIFLTSAENAEQQIKITYKVKSGKVFVIVNDGLEVDLSLTFKDLSNEVKESLSFYDAENVVAVKKVNDLISYAMGLSRVRPENVTDNDVVLVESACKQEISLEFSNTLDGFVTAGKNIAIKSFMNGDSIREFKGQEVLFSMSGSGFATNGKFELATLCRQLFSSDNAEYSGPLYVGLEEYGGQKDFNSVGKVVAIYAKDVIDPKVTMTVSVSCNGQYLTSTNGVLLKNAPYEEYEYVRSYYGNYNVEVKLTDSSGNASRFVYGESVYNYVRPEIELESNIGKYQSVGDFVIPKAMVEDASYVQFAEIEVKIFISYNYATAWEVKAGETVTLQAGTYHISYIAKDGDTNVAMKTYTVVVK